MKKIMLFQVILTVAWLNAQAQGVSINPLMMGQGYHYTHWNSPATGSLSPFSSGTWSAVSTASAMLMRIGGNQYNIGPNKPVSGQEVYYVSIVDDIRKNGCEPVLTLPFLLDEFNDNNGGKHVEKNVGSPEYTLAVQNSINKVKTIIHYVNTVHKRNVKYVIIGNEPDLDYWWTTDGDSHFGTSGTCTLTTKCTTTSASQIAQNIAGYIKPIADAVKLLDPTIKIIGPEYTHCLPEVYDKLFTPSNTATFIGGISTSSSVGSPQGGTNQPYLDFISCHFYGPDFNNSDYGNSDFYDPTHSAWDARVTFCNLEKYKKNSGETGQYARRYRGALRYLRHKSIECTNFRGSGYPMGFMVTELNSGHKNTYSSTPSTASAAATGTDAISMQGAQNLARMYALAMEYGAASVMMWSVMESANYEDRGYLVGQSGTGSQGAKRPSWFQLQNAR